MIVPGKDNASFKTIKCPFFPVKTQSTLLQMAATKTANKKVQENTEQAANLQKQPDTPPPGPPADNSENKR